MLGAADVSLKPAIYHQPGCQSYLISGSIRGGRQVLNPGALAQLWVAALEQHTRREPPHLPRLTDAKSRATGE